MRAVTEQVSWQHWKYQARAAHPQVISRAAHMHACLAQACPHRGPHMSMYCIVALPWSSCAASDVCMKGSCVMSGKPMSITSAAKHSGRQSR